MLDIRSFIKISQFHGVEKKNLTFKLVKLLFSDKTCNFYEVRKKRELSFYFKLSYISFDELHEVNKI